MKVYIARHGEALSSSVNKEKPLSLIGREETEKIACFIRLHLSVQIKKIISSPKARAFETAEIFAEFLKPEHGIKIEKRLLPDMTASDNYEDLMDEDDDFMIIGHRPYLDSIIALLTVNEECDFIDIGNSTVICLEGNMDKGFNIQWILRPELIR